MLERLILLGILAALGMVAYRLVQRWQVRRAAGVAATDPLLANITPGVPVILYFSSPDCGPCHTQQLPAIKHLLAELGDQSVQMIEVNTLEDPAAASRWGVLSVPTTFIIDGSGQPRQVNNGIVGPQKLKQQLTVLAPNPH
jgi:thioredoxin-like negative regulator of GroEL